jgi:hypothetical protein
MEKQGRMLPRNSEESFVRIGLPEMTTGLLERNLGERTNSIICLMHIG